MTVNLADIQEEVQQAGLRVRRDRVHGLAALNDLFRSGSAPAPPLEGRYRGGLVAVDLAPGLTAAFRALTDSWLPWQGKAFIAQKALGNNIFSRDSMPVGRVVWPRYRGYIEDGSDFFRAFEFKTYLGEGRADPGLEVLKIDYDFDGNPALFIRQILDELVQLSDGYYLGKAHLKWWWGRWQTVAYFTLQTT